MTTQPQWEKIDSGNGTSVPDTFRLAVPGGWIYHTQNYRGEPAAVFVPEPMAPVTPNHFHLQPNHEVESIGAIAKVTRR